MVDEFLSEREQAEQLRDWLRANWIWMAAGVALVAGGYYGYQWWQSSRATDSLAAEARFSAMLEALTRNNREEGVRIGNELATAHRDSPYADQALLLLARLDVEGGNLGQAESRLAGVARKSDDPELRLVAQMRLARVQLAQGRHDDALATLESARQPATEARVEELRGDVLLARGDEAGALAAYRNAQSLAGTPSMDGELVDAELLGLKIDELSSAAAAAAATAPATE
ncbi:MAG TPA: tetratricopeptide repeat protein [Steroidobacteraceae bacterium]|nr:tetratricopeptide repeat protein [Steroidobacteraceae bacterium]